MKALKALTLCALAAPAAGCAVQPATVRLQPPVVVTPAPVAMVPAATPVVVGPAYKPHPGRGWARGHW